MSLPPSTSVGPNGTLDELFEILALIQTKRMPAKPVVLLGRAYWQPLLVLLEDMVAAGTIAPGDMALITVTDDIRAAVGYFTERTGAVPRRLVERASPAA